MHRWRSSIHRWRSSIDRGRSSIDGWFARWLRAATPGERRGLPRLDLHGFGVRDAIAATEAFLADAHGAGISEVRIVYGKGRHSPGGRGVLREVIPRWLANDGRRWVATAAPEPDAYGEDAAIRVVLRTREDGGCES
jgi:DNA-nicking Smr family endonuclease